MVRVADVKFYLGIWDLNSDVQSGVGLGKPWQWIVYLCSAFLIWTLAIKYGNSSFSSFFLNYLAFRVEYEFSEFF